LQRPLANVLRAVLALGWWALAMTAWSTSQDSGVKEAFQVVLKIWACVTLYMTANLLKTLLAKMLSSKFNKESHIQKIQDSLVKEYHLHMLLQPRIRFGPGEGNAAGDQGAAAGGNLGFAPYNGGGGGVKLGTNNGTGAHDVHASCGSAVGNLGESLVSSMVSYLSQLFSLNIFHKSSFYFQKKISLFLILSIYLMQRGMTNKLFGGLGHAHSDPTMGTSGEELLDSSEPRSPSEGSFAATPAAHEADLEAAHHHNHILHPSGNSLRTVYGRSNTTPLPQQQQQQRPGSVGGRQGGPQRSSTQRSGGNSLVHETAPLHQRHGPSTISGQGRRMSRLVRFFF
jgi:hypothetical protein